MAKTDALRRSKRQSKVVTNEAVEEAGNVNSEGLTEAVSSDEQIVNTEEDAPIKGAEEDTQTEVDAPTESTEKHEDEVQDEQVTQMDMAIEVKGIKSTITVSWDKKDGNGQTDDTEMRITDSDQMMDTEMRSDAVDSTEEAPSTETETKQEMQESEAAVKGKRKAPSAVETSPPKKTKLINDGFCLFVGNLNSSKTFAEVKDSLATYFMAQSLLVQDIRVDRSKKHAHVDLASQLDLTKALTLDGEMVLDKPMKIAKAKVKSEDKEKVKSPVKDKRADKDGKTIFLKNVPYNATKEDILKAFRSGVAVRFPGGSEGPKKGIAFVQFKNKTIAKKVLRRNREIKIQGRVLIVDSVLKANVPAANDNNNNNKNDNKNTKTNTKAAAPPSNTLFVSNLPFSMTEKQLKTIFQKAVNINIPQNKGKSRGYAFVELPSVADAEEVLKSAQNTKIGKREMRVQFHEMRERLEKAKVLSKTLIVMGLAEKTTAETLKNAFEGALSARVNLDKETGLSRRFGFVEFENEKNCTDAKAAMEDCEIDGSKVTVAYARPQGEKSAKGAKGGAAGRPAGKPGGQKAARGGKSSKGGRGRGAGRPQGAVKGDGNKG